MLSEIDANPNLPRRVRSCEQRAKQITKPTIPVSKVVLEITHLSPAEMTMNGPKPPDPPVTSVRFEPLVYGTNKVSEIESRPHKPNRTAETPAMNLIIVFIRQIVADRFSDTEQRI